MLLMTIWSELTRRSRTVNGAVVTVIFTRTWLRYVRVFAIANPSRPICRLSVCL